MQEQAFDVVEPTQLGLDGIQAVFEDDLVREAGRGRDRLGLRWRAGRGEGELGAGEPLQVRHRGGALVLDHGMRVDAGSGDSEGELHDEFVAGGFGAVDRPLPPGADLGPAGVGEPIGNAALVVGSAVGDDQPVGAGGGRSRRCGGAA